MAHLRLVLEFGVSDLQKDKFKSDINGSMHELELEFLRLDGVECFSGSLEEFSSDDENKSLLHQKLDDPDFVYDVCSHKDNAFSLYKDSVQESIKEEYRAWAVAILKALGDE